MSQKKPTTNQQLEEMRAMIANLEPANLDRNLQQRNNTLMLMLYGATAKYGVGMNNAPNGVLVTAQVPVLPVPANHSLQWEIAEDGKSVMLYIVLNEVPKESGDDMAATSEQPSSEMGDTAVGEVGATEETSPPAPEPPTSEQIKTMTEAVGGEEALRAVGDEFEDEIKVGLDGD